MTSIKTEEMWLLADLSIDLEWIRFINVSPLALPGREFRSLRGLADAYTPTIWSLDLLQMLDNGQRRLASKCSLDFPRKEIC